MMKFLALVLVMFPLLAQPERKRQSPQQAYDWASLRALAGL